MKPPSLLELAAGASALAAAERAGLLHGLLHHEGTAEGVAKELSLDPAATATVLEVLRTLGLVELHGQVYRATATLRDGLRGTLARPGRGFAIFAHAPTYLRDGTAAIDGLDALEGRDATYAHVVGHLGAMFSAAARELADALDADEPVEAILDVGAGSAVWSLALLERHPGARLTALDLPSVVPSVRARAERLGLAERVEILEGDFHRVDVPRRRFDRVVLANVLHLEPANAARALLARWAGALRPGGRLVIVDQMADDTPEHDRARAAYALYLALRVTGGRPHAEAVLRRWLADAGMRPERRVDLASPPSGLSALVARA